jgi:hypothetical protein
MPTERFANTAEVSALPHSCGRCPARWSGANTAHCGGCHQTFGGVRAFDLHRRGGVCLEPADAGLQLLPLRATPVWGQVGA